MIFNLFKTILPLLFIASISLTSCGNDLKENDNHGNSATEPRQAPDSEYPGSQLNDSVHQADSISH
ncbi:MAG: hypothetical protein HYX39_13315 [Bacteroidetes bacterium]|nr:hypothetical protein [Bacteroidota bacterium]